MPQGLPAFLSGTHGLAWGPLSAPGGLSAAGAEQLAWLLAVLLNQRLREAEPSARAGGRDYLHLSSSPGCLRPVCPGAHPGPRQGSLGTLALVPIIGLNS